METDPNHLSDDALRRIDLEVWPKSAVGEGGDHGARVEIAKTQANWWIRRGFRNSNRASWAPPSSTLTFRPGL